MAKVKKKKTKSRVSLKLSKPGKRPKSVIDRITEPVADVPNFLVLIYALAGVGKTTLLGTLPGYGLVIDIPDFEGGTSVLYKKAKRIKVTSVYEWDEFDVLYKMLRKMEHQFDWVAIDTISAAGKLARKKVINERDEIGGAGHKLRIQDWGEIGQLNEQLYEKFRSLPIPVIFTSQERERITTNDDEEEITRIVPNVTPASLDALLPHPMLTGRLYMYEDSDGKWHRQLRVAKHSRFDTKSRSLPDRPLPSIIRSPNLGKILAYMMGQDVKKPKQGEESDAGLIDLD